MLHLSAPISADNLEAVELFIAENELLHWMTYFDATTQTHRLSGYFSDSAQGLTEYADFHASFAALPSIPFAEMLEDRDWKESYKHHFQPLDFGGLHWVPEWERDRYSVPQGEAVVYLDPGMAFGTGGHETTRLCGRALLEITKIKAASIAREQVIDAGCGSGILALSAKKLGWQRVSGFDIDEESVRVARENAEFNGLQGEVAFSEADLASGLSEEKADLVLANIQSDILMRNAHLLVNAVAPSGALVLSGILAMEADQVAEVFTLKIYELWKHGQFHQMNEGEWACLWWVRPSA